jgi:clathrin heavy chain
MESDKYICVCETQGAGQPSNIVIVDMSQGNQVTRRPISAEAAIMNPVSKVIALRASSGGAQQLQIFNMELRAKMKSFTMNEAITFWRWISPNNIAIVTATSVFHWSIEGRLSSVAELCFPAPDFNRRSIIAGDSAPAKIFDRHANLGAGTQIINYTTSQDNKWCLVVGISQGAGGGIAGTMQLYSMEKKVSQVLQGHSGVFATIQPKGREDTAQVLCFAGKKDDTPHQLFIMEVGRDKDAPGGVFRLPPSNMPQPADAPERFPGVHAGR